MGAVYFYHMTRTPLEVTLPSLLAKSLEAGWRVAVRGRNAEHLAWLDEKLWLGPEAGFLAHGMAGGVHDADQPILLTQEKETPNHAACLMCIDGAMLDPVEPAEFERTCILFDGNDPDALAHARDQWKTLTKAGCSAQYWSQESGRWEKKAEA